MKALILAGGSGTRLWPLSRENKPKQFHALTSSLTLLQETAARLDFLPWSSIYAATVSDYASEVKRELPNLPKNHLIIEPVLRDTAPCILFAAMNMAKQSSPDEVVAIVYSDHLIQNKKEFQKKLREAENIAKQSPVIAVIEVKAKFPNPNLGYVKIGKLISETPEGTEIYALDRFVEKPDLETAKKYLLSYKYLWNTGIYVFKISTLLDAYKKLAPKMYRLLESAMKKGAVFPLKNSNETAKLYASCPKISFDYAIMEKIDPSLVRIIPADLDWSDIGNFSALFEELVSDRKHNFVRGKHVGIETEGSVIYGANGKLIATIGVKDLIVVDSGDSILICSKDRAGDVKKLVEELKKSGRKNLL